MCVHCTVCRCDMRICLKACPHYNPDQSRSTSKPTNSLLILSALSGPYPVYSIIVCMHAFAICVERWVLGHLLYCILTSLHGQHKTLRLGRTLEVAVPTECINVHMCISLLSSHAHYISGPIQLNLQCTYMYIHVHVYIGWIG